jgi:hypothetical protein
MNYVCYIIKKDLQTENGIRISSGVPFASLLLAWIALIGWRWLILQCSLVVGDWTCCKLMLCTFTASYHSSIVICSKVNKSEFKISVANKQKVSCLFFSLYIFYSFHIMGNKKNSDSKRLQELTHIAFIQVHFLVVFLVSFGEKRKFVY